MSCTTPSLFSQLPNFHEYVNKPLTKYERKLQHGLQEHDNLKQNEIQALMHDMRYLRYSTIKRRGSLRLYGERKPTVFLSLCGFSPFIQRDNFLRAFRYAFQPQLIYASQNKNENGNSQWEAVIVMHMHTKNLHLTIHGRDAFVTHVENFCELFKMSTCVIELPSWQDATSVTAIQRVRKGNRFWGNWFKDQNTELRLQFEIAEEHKLQVERNEHVRRETHVDFTTGNTIQLYHELRNTLAREAALMDANVIFANRVRDMTTRVVHAQRMLRQETEQVQHVVVAFYASQPNLAQPIHNINTNLDNINTNLNNINTNRESNLDNNRNINSNHFLRNISNNMSTYTSILQDVQRQHGDIQDLLQQLQRTLHMLMLEIQATQHNGRGHTQEQGMNQHDMQRNTSAQRSLSPLPVFSSPPSFLSASTLPSPPNGPSPPTLSTSSFTSPFTGTNQSASPSLPTLRVQPVEVVDLTQDTEIRENTENTNTTAHRPSSFRTWARRHMRLNLQERARRHIE